MMQIDGKTFYRIDDAVKEYGYTKGTLINYISSGTIEAERMEDGEWLITETGWVQLRRRKKGAIHSTHPTPSPVHPPVTTEQPDPIPDARDTSPKKKCHPEGFKEGALYVRTPEDHEDYDIIIEAAKLLKMTVGDLNMLGIRHYVRTHLKEKIKELKELEARKQNILSGLSN